LKFFLILFLSFASLDAFSGSIGVVSQLRGTLLVQHNDGTIGSLNIQSEVNQEDLLTTGKNSFATINFNDQSVVALRPNTKLAIIKFTFIAAKPESDSAIFNLIKGGLRKVSGLIGKRSQPKDLLNTPVATIGIRGTDYSLQFCNNDCGSIPTMSGMLLANGLHIELAVGVILVQNQAGSLLVNAGQFAYVKDANTAPVIKKDENELSSLATTSAGGGGAAISYPSAVSSSRLYPSPARHPTTNPPKATPSAAP